MTYQKTDLLLELLTEELPASAQRTLAKTLSDELYRRLDESGFEPGTCHGYYTPRRLGVLCESLRKRQPDHTKERIGPGLDIAYTRDGNPSSAAIGFANSLGVSVDALTKSESKKGTRLSYRWTESGQEAFSILPRLIRDLVLSLPLNKRMRWNGSGDAFLRPVRNILVKLGSETLPVQLFGISATDVTHGHWIMMPEPIHIKNNKSYLDALRNAFVLADQTERRQQLTSTIEDAAAAMNGQAIMTDELVDEVLGMTEWPVAIAGRFEKKFLDLPPEVLATTLQHHQRFFPIASSDGELLPSFIAVIDIITDAPDTVRHGLERVVRPRLEDASFFFQRDQLKPFADFRIQLRDLSFFDELGSMWDKVSRIKSIVETMGNLVDVNLAIVKRAAELCKCDLVTDMVFEFPELQGIMGCYYAQASGEGELVAKAIYDHYLPKFSSDMLPRTAEGALLSIADKIDTMVAAFITGREPNGNKDPFGLRRTSFGILRILMDRGWNITLSSLCAAAENTFPREFKAERVRSAIVDFIAHRHRSLYLEEGGVADIFEAVAAIDKTCPYDMSLRTEALEKFRSNPDWTALTISNKRIKNILRQNALSVTKIEKTLLKEEAEKALYLRVQSVENEIKSNIKNQEYESALDALATLQPSVDRFFNDVLVMAPEKRVRENRLALLLRVREAFLKIADFSYLQNAGKT